MKLYLLWIEDTYVEITGTTYPDEIQGVFSSLEYLNKWAKSEHASFKEALSEEESRYLLCPNSLTSYTGQKFLYFTSELLDEPTNY